MNISDSERINCFLQEKGFRRSEKYLEADLAIINTCSVRQMAEDRVFGLARNLKKKNPQIKIIITGCLANRQDIHRRLKNADLFTEIKNFPQEIEKFLQNNFQLSCTDSKKIENYLSIQPRRQNKFQALVPIMTGCNNFCAYCSVPYARGREISRPAQEILDEIKSLVSEGYKSIVLLGQNVNSYRGARNVERETQNAESMARNAKLEPMVNFAQLLKMVNDLEGDFWIYFLSSHPKDMSDETIQAITSLPKVCENVHLPLQAGDDEILRRMNRKYKAEDYLKLIEKIKKGFAQNKPGKLFSISTDIIVGFPGESEQQFQQSAQIMEQVGFDMVFFGQYSPRPLTAAWKMTDDVSKPEKVRREKFLNEILKKTARENNQKYLHQTVEVLIEKEKGGLCFGKTRTLKNVRIQLDQPDSIESLVGQILPAQITRTGVWGLKGFFYEKR